MKSSGLDGLLSIREVMVFDLLLWWDWQKKNYIQSGMLFSLYFRRAFDDYFVFFFCAESLNWWFLIDSGHWYKISVKGCKVNVCTYACVTDSLIYIIAILLCQIQTVEKIIEKSFQSNWTGELFIVWNKGKDTNSTISFYSILLWNKYYIQMVLPVCVCRIVPDSIPLIFVNRFSNSISLRYSICHHWITI